MPDIETDLRFQQAVYWRNARPDAYAEVTHDDPVELDVRWVPHQTQTLDAQGNAIVLDVTVVVDRDIPVGSLMWLGELDTWNGSGSASPTNEIMLVKTFNRTSDIDNRAIRRTCGLMKYRTSLPTHS